MELIVAEDGENGEKCLAIPFLGLDMYLSVPRHARWAFHMVAAMTLVYAKEAMMAGTQFVYPEE